MKKLLSLLLCAALICTFGAGCTKDEPEETIAPTEPPAPTQWVLEENVEEKKYQGVALVFQSQWAQEDAEAAVLTQAAEVFEALTGAAVEIRWSAESYDTGDILQMPGAQLENYTDQVLDLGAMAQAAGYDAVSVACLTDQVVSRYGKLAGIPQVPYVSGFYYSREAFESCGITEAPRNWSAFVEVCGRLVSGGYQPLSLDSERADDLLLLHLTQYLGAESAGKLAAEGGWSGNEQALRAAADIFDFAAAGYMATNTPAAYPGGQNKIALSNSAITYGTNTLCHEVEEAAQTDLDWGMFPYPGAGGAEPVISVDSDVLAVSTRCAEPQAAFDFILLLTTGEFDQLRVDITNGIPADPGNISPVAGAMETMTVAQTIEPVQAELTEKQMNAVVKLWGGKYKESDAFAGAMDQLYG